MAWAVHIASWLVAMARVGRSGAAGREWAPEFGLRLLVLALVVWSLAVSARRDVPAAVNAVLLAGCVAGHALAVIARVQLLGGWGIGTGPRAGAPTVVRHGVYGWIRHPIYAGTGAAILCQALILQNLPSSLLLAGAAAVIPWKMRRENRWIARADRAGKREQGSTSRVPEGPTTFRLLLEGRRSPAEYFLALARRYGDVVRLGGWGGDIYVVNHPELARQVLQTQRDAFGRDDLVSRRMRTVFGNGLVISEGDVWARERRLMQAFFARSEVERHFDSIVATAERTARRWDAFATAGCVVDVAEEMRRATLHILMTSILGTDEAENTGSIEAALQAGRDFIGYRLPLNLPPWSPLPVYRRRRRTAKQLDDHIEHMIDARRSRDEAPDNLLTLLLRGDPETGTPPDRDLVVDEVRSFIAAGHVTLTAALSWFWHLMALHTGQQAALREEIRSTLGDGVLTRDRIQDLRVTTQLLDETLRLYPPVWSIWRSVTREVAIGDVVVPTGASMQVCILAIHRHAGLWQDPDAFRPGRPAPGHELAFMPFGLGPRRCIGANLAMLELFTLVTSIARRFVLHAAGPSDPGLDARVALTPRRGVLVRVGRV